MFRINKFASLLTQTVYQNRLINTKIQRGWQHLVTTNRFYSEKGGSGERDRSGACPPCDEKKVCKTPKPVQPVCIPRDPLHPCNQDFKAYPTDFDCPVPNRMDALPQRKGNFYENYNRRQRYYTMVLTLGALTITATVYTLFKVYRTEEKKPSKNSLRPKVIVKNPSSSSQIPNEVPYLLIGGGTASFSAFRAIKSADPTAKVLVITTEGDNPYMRPPLSKEMWFNSDEKAVQNLTFKQWNGSERSLFYEPEDFYVPCETLLSQENGGVAVARGWSVKNVDVVEKKAILEDGYEISYGKCLIATGALPKNLHIFSTAEKKIQNSTTLFRDIFDFQELYEIAKGSESIAIIGGGFLGSELACALARAFKSLKVRQVFKENGNMGKILPEYLSLWTTAKVKKEGVEVISQSEVTGVIYKNEKLQLTLSNGDVLDANHVIVAVGAEANTDLAEKSSLEVHSELGGYLVNTELQARTDLYIAGDCACFYDTKLGRRRVEHHDHAVVSGRLAGENMTGASKPYWHQSMFWSDLGPDVGYEAIGIVDATLPTVGVFAKATDSDSPKGIVTATGEGIRSLTEEEIECTCGTEPGVNTDHKSSTCKKHFKKDPELKKLSDDEQKKSGKMEEDFGKGVIFYLRDDIVVGIVLWNVFNRMNIARQVLKDERKYDDLNEVAKLFNIHDDE